MENKNIVLIGFMGSGKTLTSRALSVLIDWPHVSTDAMVEDNEGRTIANIFEVRGEEYFRSLEAKVVENISSKSGQIIDSGGGIVKNQGNIDALKTNGVLIYLKTSPEWVLKRTKGTSKRPLLNVPEPLAQITKLLEERAPLYEAAADMTIDTDGKTPNQVAEEIVELLKINM